MKTAIALIFLAAACAAQADSILKPSLRASILQPSLRAQSQSDASEGRALNTNPRMVTDLSTGTTTTIIPLAVPKSNPGVGIYMDADTGRQFMTIENNVGER